jgi:hypothetical protein
LNSPEDDKAPHASRKPQTTAISLSGIDRYWIVCPQGRGQIKIWSGRGMVKALRQWLDIHQLPAIIAGVLGVIILLSALLVVGGYLLVTP